MVGPNASGKTTLLEAALTASVLSLDDMQAAMSLLLLPHAARGSEPHSLASIAADDAATVCVETSRGAVYCTTIRKSVGVESVGLELVGVVDISFEPQGRQCRVNIRLTPRGVRLGLEGSECMKHVEGEPRVAMLTAGIIPQGIFDTLLGTLKRRRPSSLEKLTITIGESRYKIDIAADEWHRLAAYIVEDGRAFSFYSAGRGLQRAFQMFTLLELYDTVLIDEIENSMHPELLDEVAKRLAAYASQRQIVATTQSLEAARILAARLTGLRNGRLHDVYPVECSGDVEERAEKLLNLLILRRIGRTIHTVRLRGCSALSHILGTDDVRLSYTLIGG